jgi:hypothetical protein
MKRISGVKVGDKVNSPRREGEGTVIKVTKRTVTVKFDKSTCKNTYNHSDSYFYESDF